MDSTTKISPDMIGIIAFETSSTKTFLIYLIILLFSIGILMVLLTDDDNDDKNNKNDHNDHVQVINESNMNNNQTCNENERIILDEIHVIQEDEIIIEENKIVIIDEVNNLSPKTLKQEEAPESVVVVESVREVDTTPEKHSESNNKHEQTKTPRRRQTRQHDAVTPPSSPPMSPRRSERKVKKPVLFDPSRR